LRGVRGFKGGLKDLYERKSSAREGLLREKAILILGAGKAASDD